MKLSASSRQSAVSDLRKWVLFFLLLTAYGSLCCSIPNLESAECSESRDAVKQFYSFHFGNDMTPSPESLKIREQFLTAEFFNSLSRMTKVASDPFTNTGKLPKSFRVGTCKIEGPEKTAMQVVLLWRDDTGSEQKEIAVDMVKRGDKWLVDGVSTAK